MLAVLCWNMLKSAHFSSALHYQPPVGYLLSYTTAGGLFLHLLLLPSFHQQRRVLLKEKADHSRSLIRTQWYHYSLNLCPMFSILLHRLIKAVATMLQHSPCSLAERAGERVKWKKNSCACCKLSIPGNSNPTVSLAHTESLDTQESPIA